ncbi:MAG: 50S ribosomal protein L1, partial [Candidatus Cloacimonetes bacterium]|nr:50S ribosomal protein L1 [Candidatus Cloacimonadota bacterium]
PVGKRNFSDENIRENVKSVLSAVLKDRPSTLKGVYIKSITICTTMGPGIKLNIASSSVEAKG